MGMAYKVLVKASSGLCWTCQWLNVSGFSGHTF